jgi:hypothetical protein
LSGFRRAGVLTPKGAQKVAQKRHYLVCKRSRIDYPVQRRCRTG